MTEPVAIVVEPDSGIPPWRQVRDQITARVGSGELAVGTQLPTIRQLARDLGIAPGTVAKAYRELETAGLIHTARRQGTVVAGRPADHLPQAQHAAELLRAAAARYVATARALGADQDTALDAVQAHYRSP